MRKIPDFTGAQNCNFYSCTEIWVTKYEGHKKLQVHESFVTKVKINKININYSPTTHKKLVFTLYDAEVC